ncbi:BAI1-associated protein 3-like isoform X2 [Ptychodera flava]|uniref:BAI1-associated protein 3-like isoform X2 n=1 Tax=Ptychodera flava TaxID=63121 RepID=UPI00396A1E01
MGRFFKQIVQSARTSSKGSVDDFLGCLNLNLGDIPSRGTDKWYELEGRTSKSNVQGQIRLKINLSTEQRPAETERWTAITAHQTILEKFVEYELQRHASKSYTWDGRLSSVADTILHQHALQNDITDAEEAVCNWLAYSKEHMHHPLDYAFLYKLLRSIDKLWAPTLLSKEYDDMLANSFCSFIDFCLGLLRKQRDLFPPANKAAYYRLEYLLICLDLIYSMKFFKKCCPFKKELHREIIDIIKKGTVDWYETVYALAEPQVQSEEEQVTSLVSLTNTLNTDMQRAVKYYHKLYQNIVKVDYFTITYKQLEKLIAEDVSRAMEEVNRNIKSHDAKDDDYSVGTSLFELYLALKELLSYKQYLSPNDAKNLALANFHVWFKYCVQRWLEIAQSKALKRIKKAVELDKISLVDSLVKHSTSAVDTSCCFAQIREFWQKLDWPDVTGSYAYVTRVTDDISKGATYYADVMHEKLKKHGYFTDDGQFDVTEQLCITINDIEHVRKSLKPLPQILGFSEIQHAMEKTHGSKSAKQCKESLHLVLKSADEDMCNKILTIVQRVGEKMKPDIKKFVFHLSWAPMSVPADDAICPLMEYLDNNLITLNNSLLRANFDRILEEIWNVVMIELREQVESNEGKEPVFYERLYDALEILIDFFYADEKGLSMDYIMSEECKLLLNYLKLNKTPTEELIELYYLERIAEQLHRENGEFGTLNVKCYYSQEREKLCIQVLSATNVIPLDSNGLSDPFVKVELCPKHVFSRHDVKQTKIIKKTLHPLFEEHFEFVVSSADCRHRGSCVLFTVMDHDIILTNDFAGEAYLPLNDIPGLSSEIPAGFEKLKTISLILSQPQASSGNDLFSILEGRISTDKAASELIKKRQQLIEKVQSQS